MRGDRPPIFFCFLCTFLFTPHARGSTLVRRLQYEHDRVYPACAGIDPSQGRSRWSNRRLPRMRGDRPALMLLGLGPGQFTPHARGSTAIRTYYETLITVYPACAGIDLLVKKPKKIAQSLPRMRGDRPREGEAMSFEIVFTPHARGSTAAKALIRSFAEVYPACAGIDPNGKSFAGSGRSLPRMRGDRPYALFAGGYGVSFTPHARGSTFHRRSFF